MAEVMRRPFRYRRRRLVSGLLVGSVALGSIVSAAPIALADTSPYPNPPLPSCLPEQFPHAGAARGTTSTPYEIPFSASLNGGYLEINSPSSLLTVILGGTAQTLTSGTGAITATACGLLTLPSQTGGISGNPYGTVSNTAAQYNNNFHFDPGIPVSLGLKGVPGIDLLSGQATADGQLTSSIEPTPAANGGLNIDFFASAKATTIITPTAITGLLGLTLPGPLTSIINAASGQISTTAGGVCTVPIGDLRPAGVDATDIAQNLGTYPPGNYTQAGKAFTFTDATKPVHLSTTLSTNPDPILHTFFRGEPITGPITGASGVLVANDFPVAKIFTNTAPSPDSNGNYDANATPSTLCTQTSANLFNTLLGLPSPAGYNTFYAPSGFGVHTSQ